MALEKCKARYEAFGQSHVFQFFEEFAEERKKEFLKHLMEVDLEAAEFGLKSAIANIPSSSSTSSSSSSSSSCCISSSSSLSCCMSSVSCILHPPSELVWECSCGDWGMSVVDSSSGMVGGLISRKSSSPDSLIDNWRRIGLYEISCGRIGVVLMAGGQGSRLSFSGPKGCYPISPVDGKSFYQVYCERLVRVKFLANRAFPSGNPIHLPLYVMVSASTALATIEFFKSHDYFGIPSDQVRFFHQPMVPSFSLNGKLILEAKDRIAMNPNGNGGVFAGLEKAKLIEEMKKTGIHAVHVVGIDNLLCKVADPTFIGYCTLCKTNVGNKCVEKIKNEKVGIFCSKHTHYQHSYHPNDNHHHNHNDNHHHNHNDNHNQNHHHNNNHTDNKVDSSIVGCVVEYSELEGKLLSRSDDGDAMNFTAANIANHYFTVDFMDRLISSRWMEGKYHIARKNIPQVTIPCHDYSCSVEGKEIIPLSNEDRDKGVNGIKIESFIFESFEATDKVVALEVDRKEEFAPVKNFSGVDSPSTARIATATLHKRWAKNANITNSNKSNHHYNDDNDDNQMFEIQPAISYEGEDLQNFIFSS